MEIHKDYELYQKCLKVIDCNTLSQFNSAEKYLSLYFKTYNDNDSYQKLYRNLLLRKEKLKSTVVNKIIDSNYKEREIIYR
jgi:hypothetical protein